MEPLKGTFNMTDNNEKPEEKKPPQIRLGEITPERWEKACREVEEGEKMHDAWLEKKFAKYDEKQKKLKETEQGTIKPPEQG